MTNQDINFMSIAIELAFKGIRNNEGGPFGAIVVKNNEIIGRGNNYVTSTDDPTAHAEIVAIRAACKNIGSFQLDNCIIYTSCEPCPMCLGAIYWARPLKVYYGCTREDAAEIDFDDNFIYEELKTPLSKRKLPMEQFLRDEALKTFIEWKEKLDKTKY